MPRLAEETVSTNTPSHVLIIEGGNVRRSAWAVFKGFLDMLYSALGHTHPQSEVTNLVTDLAAKAPLASPALTGTPTAPTATPGTNSTQIATTAYADAAVAALVNSAPGVLDTLDELAAALGDDANFATTVTNALAAKVPATRSVSASGLATGGGALSADRTIDVPVASQAEAEAGSNNSKGMTPLRTAQAIAALGGSGSSISTPRVLYVETTGNNGTAVVGDPSKPYATAQAAFDAALALTGNYLLKLGVGSFSVTTTSVWPSRIAVSGAGRKHSLLTLDTSNNVVLCSDMTVDVTINATGAAGSAGGTGNAPGGAGGTGGTGDTGPYIELHGVYGRITTIGGDGGTGGNGGDGGGVIIGGIGGDGGTGGTGGPVLAVDCALEYLNSYGGAGGNGGDGGMDGGAGGGGLGNSGASGAGGTVSFYHSRVGDLNCDTYNFGLSSLGSANLSSLGSDYGATSSFTWLNIT